MPESSSPDRKPNAANILRWANYHCSWGYIFNGFKTPEVDTGATTGEFLGSNSDGNTILTVSDASLFDTGQTIIIDKELMEITDTDY